MLNETYITLIDEYNKYKKNFIYIIECKLNDLFKEFLNTHNDVYALLWNQYTSYSHDNELYAFSVGDLYAVSSLQELEDIEYTWQAAEYASWPFLDKQITEFRSIFNTIPEEIFYNVFGDNKIISVSREGVNITEYHSY